MQQEKGEMNILVNYDKYNILLLLFYGTSDGSGSKRMSDGCYKRSNRRSNGSTDGSGSNGWIKEKFKGGGKL